MPKVTAFWAEPPLTILNSSLPAGASLSCWKGSIPAFIRYSATSSLHDACLVWFTFPTWFAIYYSEHITTKYALGLQIKNGTIRISTYALHKHYRSEYSVTPYFAVDIFDTTRDIRVSLIWKYVKTIRLWSNYNPFTRKIRNCIHINIVIIYTFINQQITTMTLPSYKTGVISL